jgi:hypothetical protein
MHRIARSEAEHKQLISNLDIPEGYKHSLLRLPHGESVRQLVAWTRVAHNRRDRGEDAADLAGLLELPRPTHDTDLVHPDYRNRLTVWTRITARATDKAVDFLYWIIHRRSQLYSDKFTVPELHAFMLGLGITRSQRWIRDVIRRGEGERWHKHQRSTRDRRQWVYAMHSKTDVAAVLGLADLGARIDVKDSAWQANLEDWHAAVYTGFKEAHPGNGKLSQETLAREFGISRRTAFYYDQRAAADKTPQVTGTLQPRKNETQKWEEITKHQTAYHWRKVRRWKARGRTYGEISYCWQDVSVTTSTQTKMSAHGGARRKRIRAALKARICAIGGQDIDQRKPGGEMQSESVSVKRFTQSDRAHDYQQRTNRPVKIYKENAYTYTDRADSAAWRFKGAVLPCN